MKTAPLDFVLGTLTLALLAGVALGTTALISMAVSRPYLGPYFVVADVLVFLVAFGLSCAAGCALINRLGALPEGSHSMDGRVFTWWKLYNVMYEFGRGALLPVTTVIARPLVATLFGTQLGRDVALAGRLFDPQLITLGDEVVLGQGSVVTAHTLISGKVILAPISIGSRATVGVNSVVMSGTRIGEGAVIAAGAVVSPNTVIPAHELWGGAPAVKIKSLT